MFDKGKKYWINLDNKFNIKGEVIEETPYLIRIKRDDGTEDIVAAARITNINIAKDGA
jgi:hypothetical protein